MSAPAGRNSLAPPPSNTRLAFRFKGSTWTQLDCGTECYFLLLRPWNLVHIVTHWRFWSGHLRATVSWFCCLCSIRNVGKEWKHPGDIFILLICQTTVIVTENQHIFTYEDPLAWINVVNICFCEPQTRWNFRFLYVDIFSLGSISQCYVVTLCITVN